MAGELSAGKIAVVTGAGSGIGRGVTQSLLSAKFNVILAGRRREPLEETAAGAGANAARALVQPTDVADRDSVGRLFQRVEDRFGRLDLLFNNAGMNIAATPLQDVTIEQWQAVVDANLTGTFLCTQEAFRLMRRQSPRGGRIINNGSISALVPRPHSAPYTAAKHAVTGLTKSTALEGRRYDIACGQINIGNAATEMSAPIEVGALQADGRTLPEPLTAVDNVVRAVMYMASLPLDANVLQLDVMATKMPFVGRG